MITQELLQLYFIYDPATGYFTNRFSHGHVSINARAGSIDGNYRRLTIKRERILEHQAAWLYTYGTIPAVIDHINGHGVDNRLANLRPCTVSQNAVNRKRPHPLKGAYYNARDGVWYSQIKVNTRRVHLGTFDTAEEAHKAFKAAHIKYNGEFSHYEKPFIRRI